MHCSTLQYLTKTPHCNTSTVQSITPLYRTLQYNPLHMTLHHGPLQNMTPRLQCLAVYYNTIQYTAIHYTAIHLQYSTIQNCTVHYNTVHYCTSLCNVSPSHASTIQRTYDISAHCNKIHYNTAHCRTLPYFGIHHYITRQYISVHCNAIHDNT